MAASAASRRSAFVRWLGFEDAPGLFVIDPKRPGELCRGDAPGSGHRVDGGFQAARGVRRDQIGLSLARGGHGQRRHSRESGSPEPAPDPVSSTGQALIQGFSGGSGFPLARE